MRKEEINVIFVALAIIMIITVVTIFIVQTTLTSSILRFSGIPALQNPTPLPAPSPGPAVPPLTGANAGQTITLRSASIGFELAYPAGWRKKESPLRVILSPSAGGLDPENPQDSALWVGIPVDGNADPVALLNEVAARFAPTAVRRDQLQAGGEAWHAVQISFNAPGLDEPATALVATTTQNQVGYYVVALAPTEQWTAIEPTFRTILSTFRFTQQAVLRPTDATPPPTPTPTPTPVVYVVQPGDTLSHIAVRYGVDMDALANRNGIEDPRRLRTGQQLIIPIRR